MQLLQSDFECLGQVAKHCNWSQLCIATERAKDFDVIPLVCYDLWKTISDSYNDFEGENVEDWEYYNLWYGGDYAGCNNKYQRHLGLKTVWVYFSYAQYVIESAQKDTPTGRKVLDNDFSIPVPIKDLVTIEKKYRSMAFEAWEGVKGYLCSLGLHNDCADCGCEDCKGKVTKVSGITSKAIYK